MMPESVAVLGCGPAGLIAAHAAHICRIPTVAIFSKNRKSELFGAQYLHMPIPGATERAPVTVKYTLDGKPEDYRRKVYGDSWDGSVSPEDLVEPHEAWDIRSTYDNLWSMYSYDIQHAQIGPSRMEALIDTFELVISAIPAPALCHMPGAHTFKSQNVWAYGDAPERGQNTDNFTRLLPDNNVICNGNESPSWYRMSRLFGFATVEWPENRKPPIPGVAQAIKPLWNDCDCYPTVVRVGRYGRWEKGQLTHHAYQEVMDRCLLP